MTTHMSLLKAFSIWLKWAREINPIDSPNFENVQFIRQIHNTCTFADLILSIFFLYFCAF